MNEKILQPPNISTSYSIYTPSPYGIQQIWNYEFFIARYSKYTDMERNYIWYDEQFVYSQWCFVYRNYEIYGKPLALYLFIYKIDTFRWQASTVYTQLIGACTVCIYSYNQLIFQ